MGKIIEFPCRDYYEDWQYEDYYGEDEVNGYEVLIKENCFKGFIRGLLMFILSRL